MTEWYNLRFIFILFFIQAVHFEKKKKYVRNAGPQNKTLH